MSSEGRKSGTFRCLRHWEECLTLAVGMVGAILWAILGLAVCAMLCGARSLYAISQP